MPSVVTANHLRSGAVVYLTEGGRWADALDHASVASTPDELERLEALALAAVERNEVTSVYAFDVRVVGGRPEPQSVRERIRAAHASAA
jgi:hypothetical protein